jgi:hypothetical protein
MKRALSVPALQLLCAAVALFLFTWPFLVFERPIYVCCYFFGIWLIVIGVLFAFSRAADADAEDSGLDPEADDA